MTTLRVTRFVDCPFSAVVEFSEEALQRHPDVRLSPAPAVAQQVRVSARTAEDISDAVRRHDALLIAWTPALARFFPQFHGALTVRPKGRGAWLRIQGSYEPPLGIAGRIFDTLAGRFIAQLTLVRLVNDLAVSAERRWHTFCEEITA